MEQFSEKKPKSPQNSEKKLEKGKGIAVLGETAEA